jgi:hypothetical protein
MIEQMPSYALIDDRSHNILGEFASHEEAEAMRAELIEADASVEGDLRIAKAESPSPPATPTVAVRR